MVNADSFSGMCQKSNHKFFCSPNRIFPLSPEIVHLKFVCLCSEAKEMNIELLFPLLD